MQIFFLPARLQFNYNRLNIHVEHITCDANVPFMYLTARISNMIIVLLKLQKKTVYHGFRFQG